MAISALSYGLRATSRLSLVRTIELPTSHTLFLFTQGSPSLVPYKFTPPNTFETHSRNLSSNLSTVPFGHSALCLPMRLLLLSSAAASCFHLSAAFVRLTCRGFVMEATSTRWVTIRTIEGKKHDSPG